MIFSGIGGGEMGMKKYELKKATAWIEYKDRRTIEEGCTRDENVNCNDDSAVLKSFDNREDALKALEAYETDIRKYSYVNTFYEVTEYYVEENEYEYSEVGENCEWTSGGDVLEFSKINIEVRDFDTGETIANCSSYLQAEKVQQDYTGEAGAHIVV